MPAVGPVSYREFIAALRRAGFEPPAGRGKHQVMGHPDGRRIVVPNPHRGDISPGLLLRLLKQAGISREEWEAL